MMKRRWAVLLGLGLVALSACEGQRDPIVGQWNGGGEGALQQIVLEADGTGTWSYGVAGPYEGDTIFEIDGLDVEMGVVWTGERPRRYRLELTCASLTIHEQGERTAASCADIDDHFPDRTFDCTLVPTPPEVFGDTLRCDPVAGGDALEFSAQNTLPVASPAPG